MSDIIVPEELRVQRGKPEDPDRAARRQAWAFLGWTGFVLAGIGVAAIGAPLLVTLSPHDGAWRFRSAAAVLDGLLLPTAGLGLLLTSSIATRRLSAVRLLTLLFLLLAPAMAVVLLVLYSGQEAILNQAAKQSATALLNARGTIARGTAQSALFAVGFLGFAFLGWKHRPRD